VLLQGKPHNATVNFDIISR